MTSDAGGTNRERVLWTLRQTGPPLDDDVLASRAGISPRQTVNQICRALAREGLLERVDGPDGKIVNRLTGDALTGPAAGADETAVTAPAGPREGAAPPGSSTEQRAAERYLLDALGERLGVHLDPYRLVLGDGVRVEIDGADSERTVLVECWAHQGPAKVGQRYKLANDALKLFWASRVLPDVRRRILCVSDEAAVRHLRGNSWHRRALADLGVEIEVVTLPADVRESVARAQRRQVR